MSQKFFSNKNKHLVVKSYKKKLIKPSNNKPEKETLIEVEIQNNVPTNNEKSNIKVIPNKSKKDKSLIENDIINNENN